jgi:hypothetical protein
MMAAFSHFYYFESRAQFLPVAVVSASRVIARRSIDQQEIAGRLRAAAIKVLLFAWALLAMASLFLISAGFLA